MTDPVIADLDGGVSEDDFALDAQVDRAEETADEPLEYPDVAEQDDADEGTDGPLTVSGIRSPAEAIEFARKLAVNGTHVGVGLCLKVTRTHYNVPPLYPDASTGWREAEHKHRVNSGADVPRGAPVWWTGGSNGFGHVALATGDGRCYSTDFKRSGKVDLCKIDDITRAWGLEFKGWTNDINGVFVKATPKDRQPQPEPKERRQPNIERAVANLRKAREAAINADKPARARAIGVWIRRLKRRFGVR